VWELGCLRGARSSRAQRPTRPWLLSYGTVSTILHVCVDTSRTSPTSPLHGVLVQVACAAPAHPEPFSLRGLGSSPPVQLPACTRRDNARDAGSLVRPVLCTAYWSRVPARPPAHPEPISLRDCGSSLPFQLPAPHSEGRCQRRWVPLTTHHHTLDHWSRHTCSWRERASIKDRKLFSLRIATVVNIPPST